MKKISRFVGLDVHAEKIVVAVAEREGEPGQPWTIPNSPECVRKLVRRLGEPDTLKACYEAGPCGFVLYWQLTELGVDCMVAAPTLIPVKPGDRVKTDGRDARKLARTLRSGDLTPAWVPTPEHEALRDLVRARGAAKKDEVRAKHRLEKFLLRHGVRVPKCCRGPVSRLEWAKAQRMVHAAQEVVRLDYIGEVDHVRSRVERLEKAIGEAIALAPVRTRKLVEALQGLRGIASVSAASLVAEIGSFQRFKHPKQLMGYVGIVSSEDTTGGRVRRGPITKTGNSRLRHLAVEAAWNYRFRPNLSPALRKRQANLGPNICEIGWKAQHRLHKRYVHLVMAGKSRQEAVTAVGRELLGFIWDVGRTTEAQLQEKERGPMSGRVPPSSLATVAPATNAGTPLAAPPSTSVRVLAPRGVPPPSSGPH
jgi:transposase